MSEQVVSIPTDFYTDAGFLKSITMPSAPLEGETVVLNGKMYTVTQRSWDFDAGGIPILLRINVL